MVKREKKKKSLKYLKQWWKNQKTRTEEKTMNEI